MAAEESLQYVTVHAGIACGGFLGWCIGSRRHVRAGVVAAILPLAFFSVLGLCIRLGWLPLLDWDAFMRGGHISWRAEPVVVPLPVVYGLTFAASVPVFCVFGVAHRIWSRCPEAIPDRVSYRAVASCTALSWPLFVAWLLVMERKTDAGWVPGQADKEWLLTAAASALVGWLIGCAIAAVHQRHRPGTYPGHLLPDGEVLVERGVWTGTTFGIGLLVLALVFRGMLQPWVPMALVHLGLCAVMVRAGVAYRERVWAGAYARRNGPAVLYIEGTRRRLHAESGRMFATAFDDLWPSVDRRLLDAREG